MGRNQLKAQKKVPELAAAVARAQKGDRASLVFLISATKDRLFRFLLLLGADETTAQDLCQDTFVYALQHLEELKTPEAFVRWLYLVARSRFVDSRKGPRNRDWAVVDDLKPSSLPEAPDPQLILHIRRTLGLLPLEDRMALLLVDMEGHSYQEAAEIMGLSEAALTSRLHRARARFHECFYAK